MCYNMKNKKLFTLVELSMKNKKKTLKKVSVITGAVIILTSIMYLMADEWGMKTQGEGPTLISSCEELQDMTLSGEYALVNDIDCSMTNPNNINFDSEGKWSDEKGFDPIGKGWAEPFEGGLDGGGFTISGIYIDRPDDVHIGLFGYTGNAGVIQFVQLEDVEIRGGNNYNVGGIVGENNGEILNSSSRGIVSGGSPVGGLVGTNEGKVNKSYSDGMVMGGDNVGGIVGQNYGDIENSYSTSAVYGVGVAGGAVGSNSGDIENSYSTGLVRGENIYGGFLGMHDNDPEWGGELTANFWDMETSGQSVSAGDGQGLQGKESVDLNKKETFLEGGWDFWYEVEQVGIWDITENITYPYIKNNKQEPPPTPKMQVLTDQVPGTYELLEKEISIMSAGDEIYYTINGGDPSCMGTGELYEETISITSGETIIRAVACKSGYESEIGVFKYTLVEPVWIEDQNGLEEILQNYGGFYALNNDIALTEEWDPIGNEMNPFDGVFDGNGYTIYGLSINEQEADNVGFFGYVDGAEIRNVRFNEVSVIGGNTVGGVVGYNQGGDISNISISGSVSGGG